MKGIPLTALLGLLITGLYFAMAILAPWIAPYGMSEIVGDVLAYMCTTSSASNDPRCFWGAAAAWSRITFCRPFFTGCISRRPLKPLQMSLSQTISARNNF